MSKAPAEQIDRIKEMESYLDEVTEAVKGLSDALTDYLAVREKYYKLEEYYESEKWMEDFEADEAGKIPKRIKRGVLSEDTLFDLITEHEHLLERIEKVSIEESASADLL